MFLFIKLHYVLLDFFHFLHIVLDFSIFELFIENAVCVYQFFICVFDALKLLTLVQLVADLLCNHHTRAPPHLFRVVLFKRKVQFALILLFREIRMQEVEFVNIYTFSWWQGKWNFNLSFQVLVQSYIRIKFFHWTWFLQTFEMKLLDLMLFYFVLFHLILYSLWFYHFKNFIYLLFKLNGFALFHNRNRLWSFSSCIFINDLLWYTFA